MTGRPELSVVVFSFRDEETVLAAVDSLREQDEGIEIVVSHSGGGRTSDLLRARPDVRVLASDARLLPGAARNAGVAAAAGEHVAFLAADCLAAPGWVANRMRRHREGADAVASAVLPLVDSLPSRAVWLTEHSARLPTERPRVGALHGMSFARPLLERVGPFREDMVTGEDTLVTDAVRAAGARIAWAPEVVSLHRYPTTVRAAAADAFRRGVRRTEDRADLGFTRPGLLVWALAGPRRGARRALAPEGPLSALEVMELLPLMTMCAVVKAAGMLAGMVGRREWTR